MRLAALTFILLNLLFSACAENNRPAITIAINPWPGYEFLYLAEQKGFFEQVGLNVELKQQSSLADAQRAYINGQVDGLASTLIEVVQAEQFGGAPLLVALVPDYSDGGDVIIANTSIDSVEALKGKTVGCEISSLGIYILQRALHKHSLNLGDVNLVNTEQAEGEQALLSGTIDAFVSYPPVSISLVKHTQFHEIFTSAEIPNEIIDTVALSKTVIADNPDLIPKLHQAWQMSLDYYRSFPKEAAQIMAEREGIRPEEFIEALSGLHILDINDQQEIFSKPKILQDKARSVCDTLVHVDALSLDCSTLPNMVYQGPIQ